MLHKGFHLKVSYSDEKDCVNDMKLLEDTATQLNDTEIQHYILQLVFLTIAYC